MTANSTFSWDDGVVLDGIDGTSSSKLGGACKRASSSSGVGDTEYLV